jgi:hypothetical protein
MVHVCSAAGTVVGVRQLDAPVASRTLPSGGSMRVNYIATVPGLTLATGNLTVTFTSGRNTICTSELATFGTLI